MLTTKKGTRNAYQLNCTLFNDDRHQLISPRKLRKDTFGQQDINII